MNSLRIDVYTDISCPWCFIGMRRLRGVLDEMAGSVAASVHHHPYLLHPDAPAEGVDLHALLKERYGADPRPMFGRVEAAAREAGIPLDLSVQRYSYDTTAAHTLLRHAAAWGNQVDLEDALFTAYFLEGRNISDPEVLVEVASRHGFSAEEVRRLATEPAEAALTRLEAADAARSGVRGVPLFIFDERISLSGAQPPELFRDAIRRVLAARQRESAA